MLLYISPIVGSNPAAIICARNWLSKIAYARCPAGAGPPWLSRERQQLADRVFCLDDSIGAIMPEDNDDDAARRKIRRRTRVFVYVWAFFFIAQFLAAFKWLSSDLGRIALAEFAVWLIMIAAAVAWGRMLRCPRCGNRYWEHAIRSIPQLHCAHCDWVLNPTLAELAHKGWFDGIVASPTEVERYAKAWRKLRFRTRLLVALLLVPFVIISVVAVKELMGMDSSPWVVVLLAWLIPISAANTWLKKFRCPRCGKQYHNPRRRDPLPDWLCNHCGLLRDSMPKFDPSVGQTRTDHDSPWTVRGNSAAPYRLTQIVNAEVGSLRCTVCILLILLSLLVSAAGAAYAVPYEWRWIWVTPDYIRPTDSRTWATERGTANVSFQGRRFTAHLENANHDPAYDLNGKHSGKPRYGPC